MKNLTMVCSLALIQCCSVAAHAQVQQFVCKSTHTQNCVNDDVDCANVTNLNPLSCDMINLNSPPPDTCAAAQCVAPPDYVDGQELNCFNNNQQWDSTEYSVVSSGAQTEVPDLELDPMSNVTPRFVAPTAYFVCHTIYSCRCVKNTQAILVCKKCNPVDYTLAKNSIQNAPCEE